MRSLRIALAACSVVALSGAASADACRPSDDPAGRRKAGGDETCRPDERLRPYEPGAVRAGRDPGFVDLGNGTEVRVGGRVRVDYDVRR